MKQNKSGSVSMKNNIKRTIRELKVMELVNRYGFSYDFIKKNPLAVQSKSNSLVWNTFFDLKENKPEKSKVRYSIYDLERMDKDAIKEVIEEYWFHVYYQIYKEKGIPAYETQDPRLLAYLGLPYNADSACVKKRFRELIKKYHPDSGGDTEKFLELMDMVDNIKNI
jgi:hypothetical protein